MTFSLIALAGFSLIVVPPLVFQESCPHRFELLEAFRQNRQRFLVLEPNRLEFPFLKYHITGHPIDFEYYGSFVSLDKFLDFTVRVMLANDIG